MKNLRIFGITYYWYLLILVIVVIFVIIVYRSSRRLKSSKISKETKIQEMKRVIENILPELDSTTQRIILAQAMHETGVFSSPVFKRNNNLFGMREAQFREYDHEGDYDQDGYANYMNVEQSVNDLKLWLEHHDIYKNVANVKNYTVLIKRHKYFEGDLTQYQSAMQKHFETIEKTLEK